MPSDAYAMGRTARFCNQGDADNPYAQPEARYDWLQGWREADRELRAKGRQGWIQADRELTVQGESVCPAEDAPGPWKVSELYDVVDRDGDEVAFCIRQQDARRIVAAVNALKGVPTDYLERLQPGALADVIEGLID